MPRRASPRQPAAARHVAAIGVYSLASLLLTWPLATRIATHVPGDGIDNPALAWNLWWIKARLVDQLNLDVFHVGWMFHPIDINLAFFTLTPLNGLLSIPLQTAADLIIANNVILLSSFVLGSYGTFLLALHIQNRIPPFSHRGRAESGSSGIGGVTTLVALTAGLVYGFASAKLFYAALGQFNIASSQWIPFVVLYIVRLGDSTSVRTASRDGAMAGLFMVMQAWAELTYASFLLVFFALYVLWWTLVRFGDRAAGQMGRHDRASIRAFAAGLGAAALVFIVGLSPYLAAMLPDMATEGDFFASGGGFANVFSADLMGYLAPTRLHPLFGDIAAGLPFPNDKGQHIYVGYTLLLLAALGIVAHGVRASRQKRGNQIWFWLFAALVFWLLTLGLQIRWAGSELPIPGPFALVSRLPFFSGNRYPSRYSVMLLACVSALSVYGLRFVTDLVASRDTDEARTLGWVPVLVGAFAALFVFEHISIPLPLTDFRVPPIYQTIAADPDDFTIMELPTGWRNGARVLGKSDILIMMQQWYQTEHGKRRLGGNTSRNPPLKFQYFTEAPLIGDLIALMNADREHIAAVVEPAFGEMVDHARQDAPGVFGFLGAKYLILHVEKSPDLLVRFVEEALPVHLVDTWQAADWSGAPSTIRLYQVRQSDAQIGWDLDLAAPEGRLHMAEGWSALDAGDTPFRYATRPQSILLLDLPLEGGTVQIELAGIADDVVLHLNSHRLTGKTAGDAGWIDVDIPPGIADEIVDRLTIDWHGGPLSITEMEPPLSETARPIGETGASLSPNVALAVRSAGEEVGDFAHVYVNGIDRAPGGRGYNLVAVTPDGEVLDARAFDTHASPAASAEMAAWLDQWPAGTIIAGAVADDASYSLQSEVARALAGVGAAEDLRGKFRWSHAFVGVAGAPPGTALEEASLLSPADVSVGAPVDAPHVTGGIGRIRFSASD